MKESACLFIVLTCIAFVADFFDTEGVALNKVIMYSAGTILFTLACVSVIVNIP